MLDSESSPSLHDERTSASSGITWLKTPTGAIVGGLWLILVLVASMIIPMRLPLLALELAAAAFGLHASSVAFRRDRVAGLVILIALVFSFALLNTALFMTTRWSNPMAR